MGNYLKGRVSNTFNLRTTHINILSLSHLLCYFAWTCIRPGTAPWPDPSSSWSSMTSKYSGEQHQHVWNILDSTIEIKMMCTNKQSWRCWVAIFEELFHFGKPSIVLSSVNYIDFFRWLYHLCEIKDNCVSANSIRRVFSLTLFQLGCNELLTPLIQAQELYNPVEHIFPWRTLLDTNHWSNIMHVFTAILILSLYTFKGYHT